MNLRPYQRAAIEALYAWFSENATGNPLLVMPTGCGKSHVIATLVREILETWPGQRVLMLTHVKELIEQNARKLAAIWPLAPLGIYSAGLRRKDTFEPVIFAGIQSAAGKAMQLGRFDLILVDECHLIGHKAQGQYRAFLDAAREINPAVRIVGLTATPWRTGSGSVMHGDDALFNDVAFDVPMLDLIDQGYLSRLVSKRMVAQIDTSAVQTRNGEFVAGQLERAADNDALTRAALDECEQYGAERRRWLVFCAGVKHAEHVAQALNARGIRAGCVTGKTASGERDRLIAMYRAGQMRALTNANVLTTGFDAPETDLLVMLRPTQSPGLYVQMCGRGSRIAEGKENCLVLDFAGNVQRHGPVDQVKAWIPRPKEGASAPVKACPVCQAQAATAVRICPACGHVYEFSEHDKHDAHAHDGPILSSDVAPRIERHAVHSVEYMRWPGRHGRAATMRVDYRGPFMRIASEWICFDHEGYARTKAVTWWAQRAPASVAPKSVAEALSRHAELREPAAIDVDTQPKYPEIKGYVWTTEHAGTHADPQARDAQDAA